MRKSSHGLHGRIGPVKIDLVLRHQWEKETDLNWWERNQYRRERRLGIWWKTYRTVGSTKGLPKWLWKDSHSPNIMIGLDLIWAKCWIGLGWGTLILNLKDNETHRSS